MEPDWQQVVTLSQGTQFLNLEHNLGTTDLLIDLQAGIIVDTVARRVVPALATAATATQLVWTDLLAGVVYAFGLPDDDHIILVRQELDGVGLPLADLFSGDLTLRVRAWKLG
jgi:hypothetical protein